MVEKLRPSYTFTEDRLEQLKAVVPEAFADGKINWDVLREALGEQLEDEETERFGLFWPGKRESRLLANLPSKGTLVHVPGKGVNEETSRNIFIEGENLEVLKLLLKSYAGQVKLVYIDPPYNTGNDFIYNDDFSEPIETYLKLVGQVSSEDIKLTTNTRSEGRFHSNWLNMMYPRMILAHKLLSEDGVMFVSIDDNEVHHLRDVLVEIFGEENFIGQIAVQLNPRGRHLDRFIAKTHEYLLIFTKDSSQQPLYQLEKGDRMKKEYNKEDSRGKYREIGLRNRNPAFNSKTRPNLYYPIFVNPKTGNISLSSDIDHTQEVFPLNSKGEESCWTWSKEKFGEEKNLLYARKTNEGEWRIFRKDYLIKIDGNIATTLPKALWLEKNINNDYGKKAIQELFGKNVFDFPKSPELIKKILDISMKKQGLVLDFFAGSATSAHAVLGKNYIDNGTRRFIMVQLPERIQPDSPAYSLEMETIADIGIERIRRIIKKLARDDTKMVNTKRRNITGFKVFKLTRSHFHNWQNYQGEDVQEYQMRLNQIAETPLIEGWKREDVLTEIVLQLGFPLDSKISRQIELGLNTIFKVQSEYHEFNLYVCLDDHIRAETAEELSKLPSKAVFICLDSALTDELKMQLDDAINLFVI